MAKGSSKSTADVYGRSGGCVGEYRRSGDRPLVGGTTGTEDPDQAVPGGLSYPSGAYGEPVAVKVARRVREAVRGNGPVERPEPRPGPTSQRPAATSSAAPSPATPRSSPPPSTASGSGADRSRVACSASTNAQLKTAGQWAVTGSGTRHEADRTSRRRNPRHHLTRP